MSRIVDVRWREAGPIIYAELGDLEVSKKSKVIIRTDKGKEMGWVVIEPRTVVWSQPDDGPLASVIRKATLADWGRQEQIKEREEEVL